MDRTIALAFALALTFISPVFAQTPDDVIRTCPDPDPNRQCEYETFTMRRDIPNAYAGDYQAQRNVSFCLVTGCDGFIVQNVLLGCAWRVVIIASGNPKVDQTDIGFLSVYCSKPLDALQRSAANAQAQALFRDVYKREMPHIAW